MTYWQPLGGDLLATSLTLKGVTIDAFDQSMASPGQSELATSAAVAGYALGIEQNLSWKSAVISFLAAPPLVPAVGDRYIATVTGPTWIVHYIYTYQTGGAWLGDDPKLGDAALVLATNATYIFNGISWVQSTSTLDLPHAIQDIVIMSGVVTPSTKVYIALITEPGFVIHHVYKWLIVGGAWFDVFGGLPSDGYEVYDVTAGLSIIFDAGLAAWTMLGKKVRHSDLQEVPALSVTHTQINSWMDQSVKIAASPTLTGLKILDTPSVTTADLTFNGTQLAVNRGVDVSRRLGVFSLAGGHYATVGTSSTTGILELTSPANGIAVVNANDPLQRLNVVVDAVGNVALTPSGTVATTVSIGHPTDTSKQYRMVVSALGATEFRATSLMIEAVTSLKYGTSVNEFSTDTAFAGDSDQAVPTEKATKAYIALSILASINNTDIFTIRAENMVNPMCADWPIQSLAPLNTDTVNCGLIARTYSYAAGVATDGAGFTVDIPTGATSLSFQWIGRPLAVGGSPPYQVRFGLYYRQLTSGSAWPAWTLYTLANQSFSTLFYTRYTNTDTLLLMGLTAGRLTQFELVRVAATAPVSIESYNILSLKLFFA